MQSILLKYQRPIENWRCEMTLKVTGEPSADLFTWTNLYKWYAEKEVWLIDCDRGVHLIKWEEKCD